MGESSKPFNTFREAIAGSVFAASMTGHLDRLPEAALLRYLDEWLPAAVAASGFSASDMATHFLDMTVEVMREQARLDASGVVRRDFAVERYEDAALMERFYLNGLTGAFAFWPNHWAMLRFFEERFASLPLPSTGRCLDLGSGPGLFSARFGATHPDWEVTSVDISSHSVARTERLWAELGLSKERHHCVCCDADTLLESDDSVYDAILFSELVEHLENGPDVLERLGRRLAPDGAMFFTTALNSYFPDHRIYFHSCEEVDELIDRSGLCRLDQQVDQVAETPHGPQSDIYSVLVHPGSRLSTLVENAPAAGLHHVGLLVAQIPRSLERWRARGAELVLGPVTDLGMDCQVAFLREPGSTALVELVSPYSPGSPLAKRLGPNPLDHVCYQVSDLDGAIATREAAGARTVFGPVEAAAFCRRVAFLLDGDGLLTELIEAPEELPWIV